MYLHEYQSKEILKKYNIRVPKSLLVFDTDKLILIVNYFNCDNIFLKAQIHSGSRASFGGIILSKNDVSSLFNNLKMLLKKHISTNQTLGSEKVVEKVLIEECVSFSKSFYLSFYLDRMKKNICILFSLNSGTNIENNNGHSFFNLSIDVIFGINDYQVRYFLTSLGLDLSLFNKAKELLKRFLSIFITYDLILLEINPLVYSNNDFMCLDAKFEVDDNSFFRQKDLFLSCDNNQYDYLEVEAKKFNLNYISLTGNIGCIVNGAGLAMATMDLINFKGGAPANFLDIGGDATEEKVFNAIRLILLNTNVKCIFFNIFGGIVKCSDIANSLVNAIKILNIRIPIVTRFVGNSSEEAFNVISNYEYTIIFENDFCQAVEKIIVFSKR